MPAMKRFSSNSIDLCLNSSKKSTSDKVCTDHCHWVVLLLTCKTKVSHLVLFCHFLGIEWSFISFPDNQDILDLVEEKTGGLIAILDEKCRIPRSSDMLFARAAYEKCGEHPRFAASNAQRARGTFSVRHYAGEVEYDTTSFLEKNKDELSNEATDLLVSSCISFVASLGAMLKEMPSTHLRSPSPAISDASSGGSGSGLPNRQMLRRTSSSIMRETVGSQFAQQLRELRFRIDETMPHYVRCLKPNDDLVPDCFNPVVIADQLRCAGVLEAIRVSRVGFPHRYSHDDFVARYHMLASDTIARFSKIRKGRDLCDVLVKAVAMQVSETQHLFERDASKASERQPQRDGGSVYIGIQLGRTKVFLRRQAFETIEYLRRKKSESAAITLQANIRRFLARVHLLRCIGAATRLQCLARRSRATQLVTCLRQNRSAVKIQCAWRRFVAERYFWAALAVAEWCQRTRRGIVAREICAFMLLDYKATCIQKTWRRYAVSRRFYRIVRGIVLVQALRRAQTAKEEFRQRKKEANDLRKVAKERDTYRREALRLQRELEKNRESVEVERLRREVELLQLKLRKAQFGNGSKAVDREAADEDCPAEVHSRPICSLSESPSRARFPTSVSVTRESPDKTISSLGTTPDRRSVGSRNASPRHSSPSRRRVTNKSDIFRAQDKGLQDRSRLSSARSAGSTSLLDADDELHQIHSISEMPAPGTPRSLLDAASPETESDGSSFLDDASLLRKAIYEGNQNDFQLILERSQFADVLINDCDQDGNCPIHVAVLSSNDSIAKYLLEHGAAVNVQNCNGNTPLHLATTPSMIRILLEIGKANPNIPDTDGICTLHLAVQRLDSLSVHTILEHRADVNVADHTLWYTPLHMIAQPYDVDDLISDDLLQDIGEMPVRGQIAKMLCEAEDPSPPDIDFRDKDGNTPLHHAAMMTTKDAGEVLSCFLEHGADPNIANDRVQTPLHLICHNEPLRKYHAFQEMLHDLLFHGADPNQPSMTGCTPLHLSLYHRDIDSAIQLIHNGAELHLTWRKVRVLIGQDGQRFTSCRYI
jgi:ankyrin repeat protein